MARAASVGRGMATQRKVLAVRRILWTNKKDNVEKETTAADARSAPGEGVKEA